MNCRSFELINKFPDTISNDELISEKKSQISEQTPCKDQKINFIQEVIYIK